MHVLSGRFHIIQFQRYCPFGGSAFLSDYKQNFINETCPSVSVEIYPEGVWWDGRGEELNYCLLQTNSNLNASIIFFEKATAILLT